MFQTILSRIGWFLLLLLLQVLVFNHIHIMGYATPVPYVYFLLNLPTDRHFWKYTRHGRSHYDGHRPYHTATFQPFRTERSGQRRQHLTFNENYGALALRPLPSDCRFPTVPHLLLYRIIQFLQLDFSAYQYRRLNSADYAVLHRFGADKKKALMNTYNNIRHHWKPTISATESL